jgi:hypothetical protein
MSILKGKQLGIVELTGSLFGTSSYALTASYAMNVGAALNTSSFATTGSNTFNGNQTINGNLTLNGTASISFLNVTFESASVIFSSGSNQFGDATNDRQTLIGTVVVSGSQQITGSLNVTQGITGSLFGTASRAVNASTASFVTSLNQNVQITGSLSNGLGVRANGQYSHAQGANTAADGAYSHTEGTNNIASGNASHVEGSNSVASGEFSHAEGNYTIASGLGAHAEGSTTQAIGSYSHTEGSGSVTNAEYSHAEGRGTTTNAAYQHAQGLWNVASSEEGAFILGNGTDDSNRSNLIFAAGNRVEVTGSLNITQGITGSLLGTASKADEVKVVDNNSTSIIYFPLIDTSATEYNQLSKRTDIYFNADSGYFIAPGFQASTYDFLGNLQGTADNATNANTAATASYVLNAVSASRATSAATASYVLNAQTASYVLNAVSASRAVSAATASYVLNAISSSHAVSASYALSSSQAEIASAILGGKATHIPYFKTDTTLATSSLYQSGSSTVIINQDNATTANPEALYVYQPSSTSFNVISGKGNLNNYLQLNIQNTNQGTNASSDVVATADNGNETTNYIDMGINGENYNAGFIGGINDAYLYSTGNHLHIGNASNFPVQIFAGGSDVDIHNKLELNPNDQHLMSGSLDISGSLSVRGTLTSSGLLTNGTNTILGNTVMSGSSTIQGITTMTGSLLITGSTTQRGNNTLIGNTSLSGSIIISGSENPSIPTIQIYGDTQHTGVVRFNPIARSIDTSISASYIYVSGSTNDLYFSQNGSGYANTTRLRWLEGNLYTGLLNGGLITTQSSTVYQVGSGSGIIVNLNASYSDNPYPTISYINWGNLSASIAPLSASYDQSFVSIEANGTIFAQGTPYTDGQFNTLIPIGIVLHQNHSTINGVKTQPSLAYGWKQRSADFIRAFGPLKISGYVVAPSGSSTGSLTIGSGTSFADGANYSVDPNSPSYTVDAGTTVSKIFRYRQSGSEWVYDTNNGAGYQNLDPVYYNPGGLGVLDTVGASNYSLQRVFWYPNSVTKAIVVYYGNDRYGTLALAEAAMATEQFTEAPNTTANAVYLGAFAIKGGTNTTLQNDAHFRWMPGGLFRSAGGAGGSGGGTGGSTTLAGLSDVSITSPANNNLLAYNSSTTRWENVASITANVTGNLTGTATTASYISPTFISASAAASGFGSGGSGGGDYVASSWTGSTTSQFAGTASFATTAQNVLGSIASAATASYATSFVIGTGGTLTLDGNLMDSSTVSSTIVGSNNLFTQATGSYTSAHGKYTVYKGANSRAGEFVTAWNGTTTSYYDNSTVDIGNTTDVTFQSSIVTGQAQINAVAASSGWTVKMLVTYL